MPDIIQKPDSTTNPAPETLKMEEIMPPVQRRTRSPRSNTGLMVLTLICSLIGALSGGGGLYLYWQSLQEPEVVAPSPEIIEEVVEVEGVDYLIFNDNYLPIYEDLGINEYDLEAFSEVDGIISYPDARLGVDVSQYQGDIDWQAVSDSGVTFAIIRLGYRGYGAEGNILLDEKFHQNMEGAQSVGMDVGVYFFSQATSVWETTEEAYFVLEHLEGYELELPVVFDWEFISHSSIARTNGINGRSITLYNQVFRAELAAEGYDTMVYFNQNLGYLYLDLEELADVPFWLASYRSSPNFHYHFDIWQYTDTGEIDGIEGYVDLNLMFGDLTDMTE